MHELVNVQTRINIDLEAGLDELADLLMNRLPLRLAEVEDRSLLRNHLQGDSTDHERIQNDACAPHVRLVRYHGAAVVPLTLVLLQDFWC